jgi:hypothetical protein
MLSSTSGDGNHANAPHPTRSVCFALAIGMARRVVPLAFVERSGTDVAAGVEGTFTGIEDRTSCGGSMRGTGRLRNVTETAPDTTPRCPEVRRIRAMAAVEISAGAPDADRAFGRDGVEFAGARRYVSATKF